jgi:DNA-binding NarL/FixJ family response regulator
MNKLRIAIFGQPSTITQISARIRPHKDLELSLTTGDVAVLYGPEAQSGLEVVLLEMIPQCTQTVEFIRYIQSRQSATKCLVLAHQLDISHVRQTLMAGAMGYLLLEPDLDNMVSCIRLVNSGKFICSSSVTSLLTASR